LKTVKITYKELFDRLGIDEEVETEKITKIQGIKIKNGETFVPVEAFVKKPKMDIIEITLDNNKIVKCAKNHIFIDKDNKEVFAHEADEIKTVNGLAKVISKKVIKQDYVYDVALPYPHLYTTTNGIIHHNTKMGDAFMKHLLDITDAKLVNKREVIHTEENADGTIDEIDIITQESEGVKVAYIKNEEILADDLFWNTLKEEEYHLVFLDDLDYSLLPRTQNISTSEDIQKNKFISNLLSFTDGIFDKVGNKTKFIITTNRPVTDIDTAVLRKGRTFDILELRELKREEASEIWVKSGLDLEDFNESFKDTKILQADLGSSIGMALKAQSEHIELKPYIKEEGISIYSTIKSPKKIGL